MAISLSEQVRNARLDAIQATIGPRPVLRIFGKTKEALAEFRLPENWMSAASSGEKRLKGKHTSPGLADGEAWRFGIFDNSGQRCGLSGTCGKTGSGQDLELINPSIAKDQPVEICRFCLTEPHVDR